MRSRWSGSTPTPTPAPADAVKLQVIGDVEPRGLCGSGLVDAVAELVRVGLLEGSGRFVSEEVARELVPGLADRLTAVGQERVFVLHRPFPGADPVECVYLSQRDVRELQFAKAAISTGWTLLMEELGLTHDDVQQVLLAGSFGSYLSPASAVRIGLVPTLPVLRIVSAGNVAGEGAKMALLSMRERTGAMAAAGGGELCRALRPCRLQRPLRRAARLLTSSRARPWLRAGRCAQPAAEIAARRGWAVDVHPLPPLLHNQPQRIAGEVRGVVERLRASYDRIAIGYADCGTYGALDEVCAELGVERLPGLHCYDVYAGPERLAAFFQRAAGHLRVHRLPGAAPSTGP